MHIRLGRCDQPFPLPAQLPRGLRHDRSAGAGAGTPRRRPPAPDTRRSSTASAPRANPGEVHASSIGRGRRAEADGTRRLTHAADRHEPDADARWRDTLLELAVVLVLVALNGVFALSELAVVSARRPRLRTMAEAGQRGA